MWSVDVVYIIKTGTLLIGRNCGDFAENANLLENYERDGPYRCEASAGENPVPAVLPLFLHHQLPQEAHEARPPRFHLQVPPVYLSKCPNSWAKIKMSLSEYSPLFFKKVCSAVIFSYANKSRVMFGLLAVF
jgi:hypothetical protein